YARSHTKPRKQGRSSHPSSLPIRNVYRCSRVTPRGRAQIAPFCAVAALARSEPAVVAVGHFEPEHLVVACNRHSSSPPRPPGSPPVVCRRRAVLGNVLVVAYGERYRVG